MIDRDLGDVQRELDDLTQDLARVRAELAAMTQNSENWERLADSKARELAVAREERDDARKMNEALASELADALAERDEAVRELLNEKEHGNRHLSDTQSIIIESQKLLLEDTRAQLDLAQRFAKRWKRAAKRTNYPELLGLCYDREHKNQLALAKEAVDTAEALRIVSVSCLESNDEEMKFIKAREAFRAALDSKESDK